MPRKPNLINSKLFVFDNLVAARDFARGWLFAARIYKCNVVNPRKPSTIVNIGCNANYSQYRQYWNTIEDARKSKKNITTALKSKFISRTYIDMLPNTIWCDEVTLLKEIPLK